MTATRFAPYKGLRMFEDSESDVPFFFGREDQIDELYRLLDRGRFLAVVGTSGYCGLRVGAL